MKWIVEHSDSTTAWNVINTQLGGKRKIAIVPYVQDKLASEETNAKEKREAFEQAQLICGIGPKHGDRIIPIYEFQLKEIEEALRLTNNLHGCSKKSTCFDRTVSQAYTFATNALAGKKETEAPYV